MPTYMTIEEYCEVKLSKSKETVKTYSLFDF